MRPPSWTAWLGVVLASCGGVQDPGEPAAIDATHVTTSGAIAIANLDHLIAQRGAEAGVEDLLLARSRFVGDYDALDRATAIAEARSATAGELLRRARTRSAVHRFGDALADVAAAERAGGGGDEIAALKASILIAVGRAGEVIPALELALARRPGFASNTALATAYAAVGRLGDADRLYLAALAALDTTAPFPYAWIYFVRGMMWTEQGRDPARGEALYRRALDHLPEFATANIHLAEIEAARGDLALAIARLERVAASSAEPEALGLLGALHLRTGEPARGRAEIARAAERFDALLARHPLAFADHAAAFYLGPGADPDRAWPLAEHNLANRATDRAFALAIAAAQATGRRGEVCALVASARARSIQVAPEGCPGTP